MTTPTTNLLKWIDERIEVLNDLVEDCKSMEDRETLDARLYELNGMRNRILQERENERNIIEDSYQQGWFDYLEDRHPKEYKCSYFTHTFNPNQDER